MKMEGTASSAFQPHLMPPGPAGVKPSLCDDGMLAAREAESPNSRGPVLL